MRRIAWLTLALLQISIAVAAYGREEPRADESNNEVGLEIGATLTPSVGLRDGGGIDHNGSLALGAEYDRRLVQRRTSLYAGVDFLASPFDVKSDRVPATVSSQYAYLFLTPHIRVKWNAQGRWQPWVVLGAGYADFAPAEPQLRSGKVEGNNTGALVFGGGLDTSPIAHLPLPLLDHLRIGARFAARDFVSGQPDYGVPVSPTKLNTVAITGGLLLHF